MEKIQCPICSNEPNHFFHKGHILYSQCANCKTVFCEALDQEGLVGGSYEVERNEKENYLRIERIEQIRVKMDVPKEEFRILDFGCGNFLLGNDLIKYGYKHVDGYDPYTEKYNRLPQKDSYHIITCIECIEHTSSPYREIDVMYKALVNYGCVIFETSFTNVAEEEGIPIDTFFYVAPEAGHSTFFSHHGLDLLMALKSFIPRQHFNRHCRTYQKLIK